MSYTIPSMIRQKFLLYAALALFLAVALKFSFRTVAAVTPLCGACHETRAEYAAWKKSPHDRVSCLDCHAKPGLAGYIGGPVRALGSLAVKVAGGKRIFAGDVDDDRCLTCHDTILDDVLIKDGIKVKHRQIIDSARRCGNCHAGVGHNVDGATSYNRFSSMDKCLDCHSSGRLKKCGLCHVKKPGPGLAEKSKMGFLAHGPEWKRRHGGANSRYCRTCHDKRFCGECHRIQAPHPLQWPLVHGKEALIQAARCSGCHQRKFCDNCHILKMPHEADFDHGISAKKNRATCDRCHVESSCNNCHDVHDKHQGGKP